MAKIAQPVKLLQVGELTATPTQLDVSPPRARARRKLSDAA